MMGDFSGIQADLSWSFAEATQSQTRYIIHGYHTYPAKFIPQLAKSVLKYYLVLGLMMVLVGCANLDPMVAEYAVYDALIKNIDKLEGNEGRLPVPLIVISDQTVSGGRRTKLFKETVDWLNRTVPELSPEVTADFLIKNVKPSILERRFKIPMEYHLLTKGEEDQLFPTTDSTWDAYNQKFGKGTGIYRFSRVGFNSSKNQALVFETYESGMSGSSVTVSCNENYVWMVKYQEGWLVREAFLYVLC